jgi:lipopolysaccharide transport system ATP-binding protein
VKQDPVVVVRGLGKKYQLGTQDDAYKTLRSALSSGITLFRSRTRSERANPLWALRDINFEVVAGEVVGLIGSNGAGKSTLLKILSRITDPSEGLVEIEGRVGSLLEVGTGFHPELTGRENVFLNGAILGMKQKELASKFDQIVEFSEVERFIDTPVKRYSSGMQVRLAFSVAAHLEPDVLMVDEVLAVGDVAFQRKCLGKMGEVAAQGRTVFLVSHNMGAIQGLCTRAICLERGRLILDGAPTEVVSEYVSMLRDSPMTSGERNFDSSTPRSGNGSGRISRARILTPDGKPTSHVPLGQSFQVEMEFACSEPIRHPNFGISISNAFGQRMASLETRDMVPVMPPVSVGGKTRIEITNLNLLPGEYSLDLVFGASRDNADHIQRALYFEILSMPVFETGKSPHPASGVVYFPGSWSWDYS